MAPDFVPTWRRVGWRTKLQREVVAATILTTLHTLTSLAQNTARNLPQRAIDAAVVLTTLRWRASRKITRQTGATKERLRIIQLKVPKRVKTRAIPGKSGPLHTPRPAKPAEEGWLRSASWKSSLQGLERRPFTWCTPLFWLCAYKDRGYFYTVVVSIWCDYYTQIFFLMRL